MNDTLDQDTRDAILIAMLNDPEHAQEIAEWAAHPDNAAEIATFVEDASGHQHDADGKFGTGGGGSKSKGDDSGGKAALSPTPSAGKSKMRRLLSAAASVPAAIKNKGAAFVAKTYAKLQAKYGSTGAKLVLGGMIALMPIPIPGTSVLPIVLAEGIKRLRSIAGFTDEPVTAMLSGDELHAAVMEAMAEFHAEMGEPMPSLGNVDDDDAHAEVAAFTDREEGGPDTGATFPGE